MVLYVFVGRTIPYEIMPEALQTVADFLPLTQGIKLLKAASMGQDLHTMTLSFVVLAVIAVLGTFLSLKYFRRDSKTLDIDAFRGYDGI